MKTLYRIMRSLLVAAICMAVAGPFLLYIALSLTGVQQRIALTAESELSKLLQARVSIGSLGIVPFNRSVLRNVAVCSQQGDTLMTIRRIGAGVRLGSLLSSGPITIDYVELVGMDARLKRDSAGAPLNIQPIIDALSPKDHSKPPSRFNLKINTVMLRSSRVSYDVGADTTDANTPPRFSPDHMRIDRLRADVRLPRISNNNFAVNIKRMGFEESRSQFVLENLSGNFTIADTALACTGVQIQLPESNIKIADTRLPLPDGLGSIKQALQTKHISTGLVANSHLTTTDLGAFAPMFHQIKRCITFDTFNLTGNLQNFTLDTDIAIENQGSLLLKLDAANPASDNRAITLHDLVANTEGRQLAQLLTQIGKVSAPTASALKSLGDIEFSAEGELHGTRAELYFILSTAAGTIDGETKGQIQSIRNLSVETSLGTDGTVNLAALLPDKKLGDAECAVTASAKCRNGHWEGNADVQVPQIAYNGALYNDIHITTDLNNNLLQATASANNEYIAFELEGAYSLARNNKIINGKLELHRFVPSQLNLTDKSPGALFSGIAEVGLEGPDFNSLTGSAAVHNLTYLKADGSSVTLQNLSLAATPQLITLSSDYLDGELRGDYNWATLPQTARNIASRIFPTLLPEKTEYRKIAIAETQRHNNFTFNFTAGQTEALAHFFNLPVSLVYPAKISGIVSETSGDISLNVDIPYLRQGKKLIENTSLTVNLESSSAPLASLNFSTTMPTKEGGMTLLLQNQGHSDRIDTQFTWAIDRKRRYDGRVSLSTLFAPGNSFDYPSFPTIQTNIHHSELTFNDSTWVINPATITVSNPRHISVEEIDVWRSNQFVRINGTVSDNPADILSLNLRNFSLDYLFESLGIDKVMLGGDATGTFYASGLLTQEPVLETPGLHVENIGYNHTVLGNADVRSHWDKENRAITLDADIASPNHCTQKISGAIYPMAEALDLTFLCDSVNIAFMQPYMEAFASDIRGTASGRARIFGTFKYIDLEGDVKANDMSLRINFTNTTYSTSDSVHFSPGIINLNGITIADVEGHHANLNGYVGHKFFKEPRFEFSVTNATNFLSYNTTSRDNPVWYGKIYGNGMATVKGEPGHVAIGVDMSTAARSVFTFVLSDDEVADEFTFLTFRDKDKIAADVTDTEHLHRDTSMDLVNLLRRQASQQVEDSPSDYDISLQMRVTPEAQIVLVMDPVGGDRIRSYGSGHLRLDYGSANNDLRMYGTYTLDRGNYNFTLQDIIIKDFTINPGSRIAFNGNPYNAALDIEATYALNANLSDLDESFLQDKDLNRTNVPVHAILKVNGDIVAPEITFDLRFPTLTSDIYRKVRSIISTDDMMNRQIIYLLALNRFYTPDYMASTTKGNELMSVASSTISSQLSNLLGTISDNWIISPTFRSNRGDFSDVEVDVALSSRLLNNRLLFNGNLGYRDNALNSSQFIGDFDLEYILDRSGMWRLKAYNRYNDQNYYLRTALTTQGVGVVLKRDFDSFSSFLKPLFSRNKKEKKPLKSAKENSSENHTDKKPIDTITTKHTDKL